MGVADTSTVPVDMKEILIAVDSEGVDCYGVGLLCGVYSND